MPEKKRPEYPKKPPRVPDTSPERLRQIVAQHQAENVYYTAPHNACEDLLWMLRQAVAVLLALDLGYPLQYGAEYFLGMQETLAQLEVPKNAGTDGGDAGKAG